MDKYFFDFEFKRYTKIIKPYLDELVDKEAVDSCHAWLDKLSTSTDRAQRNKYVFKLMYQLASGSLREPFTKRPTSNDILNLEIIQDEAESNNYSCLGLDPDTSPLAAGDKTSIAPEKSCETFTIFKENSCYSNAKLKPNHLLNIKTNNSTIENRVKNLVVKLRHMKRENAMLHQLLSVQGEFNNNCGNYISGNFKETTTNFGLFKHISDLKSNLIEPNSIFKSDQDHLNDTVKIKMESVVSKPDLDLLKFKNENELEIIKVYENKMLELTKQHTNSFEDLRQYYENLFNRLKIAYDERIIEKEGIIKSKDEEIGRLKKCIDEIQTVSPIRNFGMRKIEQRLNKIERSTGKYLKNYQRKILKQRQKYIHDCSLLLELLKQRSNVTDDAKKEDHIDDNLCTNKLKKLEEKYKNIVAKVQATALQRMIQDQQAMEAVVKKISKMSFICLKSSQMNNVRCKTKTKSGIEDPSPREPNKVEVVNPGHQEAPTDNEL